MRVRDWYFQGWVRRETADGRSELVYTGEYYTVPGGLRTLLLPCALMTAGVLALYAAAAFLPAAGARWHVAAIPQLLEIIPLIYLVMGDICLLRGRERMTFRDWYASWRRVLHASAWSGGFAAAMAAVQLVFIILAGRVGAVWTEIAYLAVELCLAALCAALFVFVRRHPCRRES